MAVRREVFQAVGGFDESLTACEDVDLCKRFLGSEWRLLSDSRLENIHLGDPETLRQLFRGELWRGRDNLKVSLRPPVALGDLPSILMPVVYLLCIVGVLLGAATISSGGAVLFGLGLLGIFGLSALRTAMMLWRSSDLGLRQGPQTFLVACTFDLARALALLMFSSHHR